MNVHELKIIEAVKAASESGDYSQVEAIHAEIRKMIAEWKEPDIDDPEIYANFFGGLSLWDAKRQNRYWRHGGWVADVRSYGIDNIWADMYLDDAERLENMTSRSRLFDLEPKLQLLLSAIAEDRTPTWSHAIWVGIKDTSYPSARQGEIGNYNGKAIIKTPYGVWDVVGTSSKGTAYAVSHHGQIKFTKREASAHE